MRSLMRKRRVGSDYGPGLLKAALLQQNNQKAVWKKPALFLWKMGGRAISRIQGLAKLSGMLQKTSERTEMKTFTRLLSKGKRVVSKEGLNCREGPLERCLHGKKRKTFLTRGGRAWRKCLLNFHGLSLAERIRPLLIWGRR